MLPTPTATLNAPAPWKDGVDWWLQSRATRNLEGVVTGNTPLLKTPTAQLAVNGGSQPPGKRKAGGHGPTLADEVEHEHDWARFGPAIRRWEKVLARRAPAPVDPVGRGSTDRLSVKFTEWLMGLPDGWVTDVPGITRDNQLKLLGNGVIPAQCALALRILLGRKEE